MNIFVQEEGKDDFEMVKQDGTRLSIDEALFKPSQVTGYYYLSENANTLNLDNNQTVQFINTKNHLFHLSVVNEGANGCKYGYFSGFGEVEASAFAFGTGRNDTTICIGGEIQLECYGGTSVNWEPSTGLDDATSFTPKASPTVNTTYKAIVSSTSCFSDTAELEIRVANRPTASILTGNVNFCEGESGTIQLEINHNPP